MPCVSWRVRHKDAPIKLWHASLLIVNHMSLNPLKTLVNIDSLQSYRGDRETFRNLKTLLKIKLQILQELQPSNLDNIQSKIIQVILLDPKVH